MVKLIMHPTEHTEEVIGTIKDLYNARQCRDLLQAMQSNQERAVYVVEYKDKATKTTRREAPDNFSKLLPYMETSQKQQVKAFLS